MQDADRDVPRRPRPERITGFRHIVASAGYSISGAKRLWAETAFRHNVAIASGVLALLTYLHASAAQFCIAIVLILLLFAVEALNSAIETIVDHLSPDWALFAKDAKDLGSFAVFCLLLANGVHLASVAIPGATWP